ncbi:transposase family protein [Reticulibacter mediterranei]|uniref:transposase family protein n=1 Tax=Reticulibacter mediterranei TaxID=2778369 RepID=UPI003571357B
MEFSFFLMLPFSLPGVEVQEISDSETILTITACATAPTACCPTCGQESHRIHSYYTRCPADLPISGQTVRLFLQVSLPESHLSAANVCGTLARSSSTLWKAGETTTNRPQIVCYDPTPN